MIGLIPAAGHATRIHGLPKFLLPVPGGYLLDVLARRMLAAGVSCVYIGTNRENWDLVRRYKPDGAHVYCVDSATMSETALAARMVVNIDEDVLFGMPDAHWTDETVYQRLAATLRRDVKTPVAAAVWAVRPDQERTIGMCKVIGANGDYQIEKVVDKPKFTHWRYGWGALAWRKAFWRYLAPDDPHVGYALQRAVVMGETAPAVIVPGNYYDCGTPDAYSACIRSLANEAVMV